MQPFEGRLIDYETYLRKFLDALFDPYKKEFLNQFIALALQQSPETIKKQIADFFEHF